MNILGTHGEYPSSERVKIEIHFFIKMCSNHLKMARNDKIGQNNFLRSNLLNLSILEIFKALTFYYFSTYRGLTNGSLLELLSMIKIPMEQ